MADYTIPGIIAIVAIVLVFAVVTSNPVDTPQLASQHSEAPAMTETLVGSAFSPAAEESENRCEEQRFCSGSRLILIQEDCSQNTGFCKHGCFDAACRS